MLHKYTVMCFPIKFGSFGKMPPTPPPQSTHLNGDLFQRCFHLFPSRIAEFARQRFLAEASLGLWRHPHHAYGKFKKIEIEIKMKMSNNWWNMQRVRHPTTSNCHYIEEYAIISVEAVAQKKILSSIFSVYFCCFVFLWKWNFSSLVSGPGYSYRRGAWAS